MNAKPPAEDPFDQLLELAGKRHPAPANAQDEVKASVREVWRAKVVSHARQRRRRLAQYWALAATLLLVAAIALWPRKVDLAPVLIASVEALQPGATWRLGSTSNELEIATSLPAGSHIETSATSRVALRLTTGQSVRLDVASRLWLEKQDQLTLERGAVYIDSDQAQDAVALSVRTPYGTARDIGTQFEVRLLDDAVRINVREGAVELATESTSQTARAGISVVGKADGSIDLETIETFGDPWSWVLDATPQFVVRNRSLFDVLAWVSQETGWEIRYEDAQLEAEVATVTILSEIANLRPDLAPGLILPSSGLAYQLENGVLFVTRP